MNVLDKNPLNTSFHNSLKFGMQAEAAQRLQPVIGSPDRSYAVLNNSFAIPGSDPKSACPSNFLTVNGVKNSATGATFATFQGANSVVAVTSAALVTAVILVVIAVAVAAITWFVPTIFFAPYASAICLVLVIIAIALFIKDRNDTL
uniref:Uncharacterized protein n=1 Tax=viral metagenome TaxID=1070528 RepID=A0A6C0JVR7_9ZZZZ